MAELKTQKTRASVSAFLNAVENPQRRADAKVVVKLMRQATGSPPAMWGESIVGFGSYHYVYASGRQGDWPLVGFSPRKANLVLYVMAGFSQSAALLKRLGPHKTGKACLYLKRLSDVDLDVLAEMIQHSVDYTRANQDCAACAETRPKKKTAKKKTAKKKTAKKKSAKKKTAKKKR